MESQVLSLSCMSEASPDRSLVIRYLQRASGKFLHTCLASFLLLTYAIPQAQATSSCELPDSDRPKIGLVLGGGGARGSAHIGVLRVLEEMNIPVDYISGTSIGSLVGALYATGMESQELEEVITGIDWDYLFKDQTARAGLPVRRKKDDDLAMFGPKFGVGKNSNLTREGAISGQKINFLFESLIKQQTQLTDFDELPIPFRAVAMDLKTGDQVVLAKGDLALAMRSSMSVPGVFAPVPWDEYLLVDGGMVDNVPIDVVRDLGADIVIAVNVGSGLRPADELTNALAIVGQLTNLMTTKNTVRSLATLTPNDILIEPPLGDSISAADFAKSSKGIGIGYAAAIEAQPELQSLALSEDDYRAYRDAKEGCVSVPKRLQFVRLDNQSRFDDSVILNRMTLHEGDVLDVDTLESDIRDIYALGFLNLARYEIVQENDETGVVYHVSQDTRGTQFLETGLTYTGDGDDNSINVRLGYLKTDFDGYGSELRALTQIGDDPALLLEMYKYLGPELRWFVQPQIIVERRGITQYDEDGDALMSMQVDQYGAALSLGREFGRHGAVTGGVNLFSGNIDVDVGPPGLDDQDFDGAEYVLTGLYDRLDDRYFPGDGELLRVNYYNSDESLGADVEYEQIMFDALSARTYGSHSMMAGGRYYETLDGISPNYSLFRAGGFARLSGFNFEELRGQNFGMVMAGYRYHAAGSGLWPAYLGATLEYGAMADNSDDIFDDALIHGSAYFGYRSPIGPLYLGFGAAEGGRQTFFLTVGNLFGASSIAR